MKKPEDNSPFFQLLSSVADDAPTTSGLEKEIKRDVFLDLNVSDKHKQWITFKVSELEMNALEAYCQQTQRTKTDVLRELIRRLPTYTNSINHSNNSTIS